MTKPLPPAESEYTGQDRPRTVAEAVARLVLAIGQAEKDEIAAKPEDELIDLHFGLGTYVRNEFGLSLGNCALLADCQRTRLEGHADAAEGMPVSISPDDASMLIILALWRRLRH